MLIFFLESDAIPPVILIKKTEGDVLFEELDKGTKIVLHVDFDMVRLAKILKILEKIFWNFEGQSLGRRHS